MHRRSVFSFDLKGTHMLRCTSSTSREVSGFLSQVAPSPNWLILWYKQHDDNHYHDNAKGPQTIWPWHGSSSKFSFKVQVTELQLVNCAYDVDMFAD